MDVLLGPGWLNPSIHFKRFHAAIFMLRALTAQAADTICGKPDLCLRQLIPSIASVHAVP